jgi:hypothetical protein
MAHQAARSMSIVDLPMDVLGCIVRHLQPNSWHCFLSSWRKLQLCAACAARCAWLWILR